MRIEKPPIWISIIFIFFVLNSCVQNQKADANQLLDVDRQFSDAASEIGFNRAFIEFAHPDAILLRENSMPVVGKESIKSIYEKLDTTGIHFSWKPLAADIAISGELGFTYGIYTFRKDTNVEKGTYVSIWKRDEDGKWKYILDTGNEGLGK